MSEAAESVGVGSQGWAEGLRRRAKHLVKQLDTGYVELARLLYDVDQVPIEGDPRRAPTYMRWGYNSFSDFVTIDLGMQLRRAQRLRVIGRLLEVELAGLDEVLRQRLINLGWSKVRELARVLLNKHDRKTVREWVDYAETHNFLLVERAVAQAVERMGMRDGEAANDVVEDVVAERDSAANEADREAFQGCGLIKVTDAAAALPKPERTKVFTFACMDESIDLVAAALQRAGELGGAERSKSSRLGLICMDFLATNDWGRPDDPDTRVSYLTKLERLLGLRLVAIDPNTNRVQYGFRALKQLSEGEVEEC